MKEIECLISFSFFSETCKSSEMFPHCGVDIIIHVHYFLIYRVSTRHDWLLTQYRTTAGAAPPSQDTTPVRAWWYQEDLSLSNKLWKGEEPGEKKGWKCCCTLPGVSPVFCSCSSIGPCCRMHAAGQQHLNSSTCCLVGGSNHCLSGLQLVGTLLWLLSLFRLWSVLLVRLQTPLHVLLQFSALM